MNERDFCFTAVSYQWLNVKVFQQIFNLALGYTNTINVEREF